MNEDDVHELTTADEDGQGNELPVRNPKDWNKAFYLLFLSSVPAVLLLVMVWGYIGFDNYFVKCTNPNYKCEPIQGDLISQIDEPVNLATAPGDLEPKNTA